MERQASMPIGVIVERRRVDHPWADHQYGVSGILPDAPGIGAEWRMISSDAAHARWHAATVPLTLHVKDTPALKHNLEAPHPSVYVVLRPAEGEHPYMVRLVTASSFEAESYMQSGEEIVEALPMPSEIFDWVSDFVSTHHVEQPFFKRKRTEAVSETPQFGKEPIFGKQGGR